MKENKLIAEFMGIPNYKQGRYLMFEYADNNHRTEQDLAYHTSWDWLMPVVEKIRGLEEGMLVERIDIMPNDGVAIHYSHPPKMIVVDTSKGVDTLDATYQAVVEFIKNCVSLEKE